MSADVVSAISESVSTYISDQKYFLLPVLAAAIMNFGCRSMSSVLRVMSESVVVENVGSG